jgi:[protein-PII] uridylyltransferase
MRDYYTATRDILQRSSEIMDRFHLQDLDAAAKKRRPLAFLARNRVAKVSKFDGFIARNERIFPDQPDIFKEDPIRLIRLFAHTQQRHLRLSPELFQLVQESFRWSTPPFAITKPSATPSSPSCPAKGDVSRTLRQCTASASSAASSPNSALSPASSNTSFFINTPPTSTPCAPSTCSMASAENPTNNSPFIKNSGAPSTSPGSSTSPSSCMTPAAPLTAKATMTKASSSPMPFAAASSSKGEQRRLLIFLVDNHLLMYRTATSKNLEDPKVVEEFAAIVRTQANLDTLLVMTYADSKGTSAQSWSGYKEASIRRLYHMTAEFLNAPADFMNRAAVPVEEIRLAVSKKLGQGWTDELNAHFGGMPPAYFNFLAPDIVVSHLRQFRSFFVQLVEQQSAAGLLPVLAWEDLPEQGCSEITLTCWDRPQLLARVAGALAAQSINIVGADLFRRSDDLVLDIFRVCNTNFAPVTSKNTRLRFEQSLQQAFLISDFDFSAAIAPQKKTSPEFEAMLAEIPQRIAIDNAVSTDETVIELQAVDRLGLLYDVLKTIGRLSYNVTHARINTEKGVAVDAIYVRTPDGKKISDPAALAHLAHSLAQAVTGEVATAIR